LETISRAAPCAAREKIGKSLKVKSWSIFMISLELTLSKIPEKIQSHPAASRR
jgi:hypothetical protein